MLTHRSRLDKCYALACSTSGPWAARGPRSVPGEPRCGSGQALRQADLGLPAEQRAGQGRVGLAAGRVVLGEGLEDDGRRRGGDAQHLGGYEIVDVAEAARLGAVAVDGEGLARERLRQEVGPHPPVAWAQARSVGV